MLSDIQRRGALFPSAPGLLADHAEEAAGRRPQHGGDLRRLEPARAAGGRVRLRRRRKRHVRLSGSAWLVSSVLGYIFYLLSRLQCKFCAAFPVRFIRVGGQV